MRVCSASISEAACGVDAPAAQRRGRDEAAAAAAQRITPSACQPCVAAPLLPHSYVSSAERTIMAPRPPSAMSPAHREAAQTAAADGRYRTRRVAAAGGAAVGRAAALSRCPSRPLDLPQVCCHNVPPPRLMSVRGDCGGGTDRAEGERRLPPRRRTAPLPLLAVPSSLPLFSRSPLFARFISLPLSSLRWDRLDMAGWLVGRVIGCAAAAIKSNRTATRKTNRLSGGPFVRAGSLRQPHAYIQARTTQQGRWAATRTHTRPCAARA